MAAAQGGGGELENPPSSHGTYSKFPGASIPALETIHGITMDLLDEATDTLGCNMELLNWQILCELYKGLEIEWPEGVANVGLLVKAGFVHWIEGCDPYDNDTIIKLHTALNNMFQVVVQYVIGCVPENHKEAVVATVARRLASVENARDVIVAAQFLAINEAVHCPVAEDVAMMDDDLRACAEDYLSSEIDAIGAWESAGLDPIYEPLQKYVEAAVFLRIVSIDLTA